MSSWVLKNLTFESPKRQARQQSPPSKNETFSYEVGCWLIRLDVGLSGFNYVGLCGWMLAYHSMLAYEVGCWLIGLQDVCFE
jgi:hypothetical protein